MVALGGLDSTTIAHVLRATIAERRFRPPPHLDLVWTGPDTRASLAHDTAIVVQQLFAEAKHSVLVAGFAFDHGDSLLVHLRNGIVERGLSVEVFFDLGIDAKKGPFGQAALDASVLRFQQKNWSGGPPYPAMYYDPRALEPESYASLHAKHVVVDERITLMTSANFTDRGQTRNIEAGVLIEDDAFARRLVSHWRGLVSAGLMVRVGGTI